MKLRNSDARMIIMPQPKKPKIDKSSKFIKESVIGLGFINGLWINIGLNPENEFSNVIGYVISFFFPSHEALIFILLAAFSFAMLIKALYDSYKAGRRSGLLAVGLAFLGGALLNILGIIMLMVALAIGFFAADRKKLKLPGQ